LVIQFKHVNSELSTATFDGEVIEVRKTKDKNEWSVFTGKDKIPGKPFLSRERAIRHVNNMAEKVISANMPVVKAKQRPLSPTIKR
jgi:hypothetical protein